MTLAERAHENHLRLGVANPNCGWCVQPVPEWVRRARENRLPVKDYTKA
jgi:hypothetical protein